LSGCSRDWDETFQFTFLLELLQWSWVFHQLADARVILLPLVGIQRRTVDRQQTVEGTFLGLDLRFGKCLLPCPLLDQA
jgi:hypothetical protein